jgi:hypothetical protein
VISAKNTPPFGQQQPNKMKLEMLAFRISSRAE